MSFDCWCVCLLCENSYESIRSLLSFVMNKFSVFFFVLFFPFSSSSSSSHYQHHFFHILIMIGLQIFSLSFNVYFICVTTIYTNQPEFHFINLFSVHFFSSLCECVYVCGPSWNFASWIIFSLFLCVCKMKECEWNGIKIEIVSISFFAFVCVWLES